MAPTRSRTWLSSRGHCYGPRYLIMGSGQGGGSETQQQLPIIPQFLRGPSRDIVSSLMQALYPGGQLQQYNPNMNQQVAGFSPFQQQAQQGAEGAFGGAQGLVQGAGQANQLLTDPNMLYASSNPYLSANVNAMNQQITDAYKFGTAPSEMSSAVLSGAFGGSGDAVKRLQDQFGLSTSLGQTDLQAYNQNYQNQLGLMNQASVEAPGIAMGQFAPEQGLNQFGQEQQQQQQNVLNAGTTNAWQQQQFPFNLLQQATGILSPYLNAFSGSKTISPNLGAK